MNIDDGDLPPKEAKIKNMFSAERFQYLFKINLEYAKKEKMKLEYFIDLYLESIKLFKHLGKAISIGFKGESLFPFISPSNLFF